MASVESDQPTAEDVARRVIEIIANNNELKIEDVTLDTSFEDLGLDSLDGVNIAFDLEEEFDIEISDEAVRFIGSVRDVVDAILPLLSEE